MRKNVLILGHNDATQFIDIYNQYTRLFNKEKYEVTVAYLTGEPNEAARERTIAENVLFLNLPKKSVRNLKIKAIQQLLALCKEKKFQIVVCHRYKPTYIMLWVNQFYKIPALICVMHELGTMSSFARQLLMAALGRKNVLFAGVSNAVRDDMRKDLWGIPKERVATLYNMIDVDLTEPQILPRDEARKALNISEDTFLFGHIARLVPNKDQASLIQAFSMIKPQCSNAKLMVIGNGELEQPLKEQAKQLKLENDIIFTGFLVGGFRYMRGFDCFVLPSVQEAFGRVLLEAMLAHLPIIAARVHGIPEVMGNTGILVNPRDPVGLASAMKQIYMSSNEERAKQGQTAYQHAIAQYSIPKFHEQFWQLSLIQSIKE